MLLLVLAAVAMQAWLDRVATQSWRDTLWVGIFPLNADGSPQAQHYIEGLSVKDFASIEDFFTREAHRYGVKVDEPVHVELYPEGSQLPPALEPGAGLLGVAWWSLKLRWFAAGASRVAGRAPPRIRMFVLYHDPAKLHARARLAWPAEGPRRYRARVCGKHHGRQQQHRHRPRAVAHRGRD